MRFHVTLPELEEGASIQSGPSARLTDLQVLANNRHAVAISPLTNHDHKVISAVQLTGGEYYGSHSTFRMTFRPFWCSAFTLCSAKKDSLLALTLQFEDEQFWVDKEGWHPSHLTVSGPGTDPKAVYNSQFLIGELLANYPRPDLVDSVIRLIRKKYLLCQEENVEAVVTSI